MEGTADGGGSFPRGREATPSTPAPKGKRGNDTTPKAGGKDVLFGRKRSSQSDGKSGSKKKKARTGDADEAEVGAVDAALLDGCGIGEWLPKNVYGLRFKRLHVGMLILGCVRDIVRDEAVVSLPNNMTGVIRVEDLSDVAVHDDGVDEHSILKAFLSPGSFVRCVVDRLERTQMRKQVRMVLNSWVCTL